MHNQINSILFEDNIDEIHSFDAYYRNVVLSNNNLVIPYINLGVSQHQVNPTSDLMFIDFALMIFEKVTYLDVFISGKRYKVIDQGKEPRSVYHFGGTYLDFNKGIFNDMEICSKKVYLQLLATSILSKDMWRPIDSSKAKSNMGHLDVEYFFETNNFPENIRELLRL